MFSAEFPMHIYTLDLGYEISNNVNLKIKIANTVDTNV